MELEDLLSSLGLTHAVMQSQGQEYVELQQNSFRKSVWPGA